MLATAAAPASASTGSTTVTYTSQVSVPAPPSSNFSGASGGGDGWAVALSSTAVYNVFHHQPTLMVNCHLQSNASLCWGGFPYKTITDSNGNNFSTSGQPGLWLDQSNGHLYVFATRSSDETAGVVCIDTTAAANVADPFCGYTPLTPAGDGPLTPANISGASDPVMVGSDWYAFNYVDTAGAAPTGSEDQIMCFDTLTLAPCATSNGAPVTYPVDLGASGTTISDGGFPSPSIAAFGTEVVVPAQTSNGAVLGCFDTTTDASCTGGSWPVSVSTSAPGYPGGNGTAFPLLDTSGTLTGFCLPTATDPCFDLSGGSIATPSGLASVIAPTGSAAWNGPALTLGTRIYVPDGNTTNPSATGGATGAIECFDYATDAVCPNFSGGLSFNNLSYLYTINPDPQRPTCFWVNSDSGSTQIQNFDAYTAGPCGNAPVRVFASSVVAPFNSCVPSSWSSLQVVSPPPSDYSSATVDFTTSDGVAIPGDATHTLDATGTTSLTDLNLSTEYALPQFVITFKGLTTSPGSVVVNLAWMGTYSPACETTTTKVETPPAISTAASTSFLVGQSGSFTFRTSGAPTASISDGGAQLPNGVTFVDNGDGTATLSGTPQQGSGGVYPFTVTASNGVSPDATQNFVLTVEHPPAIMSAATTTFSTGQSGSFQVTTTGYPAASLSESGALPNGVGFFESGPGTATLFGTPAAGTVGDYPITITASNGVSPDATQSFVLKVSGPLGAPTGLTATAGDGSVALNWSPPASDGGSAVTSYTVSYSPCSSGCSFTVTLPAPLSQTINGLSNGTSYSFTVAAVNGNGPGTAATVDATPATTPGAPTISSVTSSNGSLSVDWSPPANDGGSAISGYVVEVNGAPCTAPVSCSVSGHSAAVSGLTNGTSYSLSVAATNADGTGAYSLPVAGTPAGTPGAPSGLTATDATPQKVGTTSGTVDLAFTGGTSAGGSITGYRVLVNGTDCSGTSFSCHLSDTTATVSGLELGKSYSFAVVAEGANGSSAPSLSVSITPSTIPQSAPSGLRAASENNGTALSWSALPASADGGAPITGYRVSIAPCPATGPCSVQVAGTTATVGNLTNGTSYAFTVEAVNENGTGPASRQVAARPYEHGYLLATAGGTVYGYGTAKPLPYAGGMRSGAVVAIAATPDANGYYLVGADGSVAAYGDAHYYGSLKPVGSPVVGLAVTHDGKGYWIVTRAGGVYCFGDAKYHNSVRHEHLKATVVGIEATPDGGGYWLVSRAGGVYNFGDAPYQNSLRHEHIQATVVAMAVTPDGGGYWLVTKQGGVVGFGDAHFHGSLRADTSTTQVVGALATSDGKGYYLVDRAAGVVAFGDCRLDTPYNSTVRVLSAVVGIAD